MPRRRACFQRRGADAPFQAKQASANIFQQLPVDGQEIRQNPHDKEEESQQEKEAGGE